MRSSQQMNKHGENFPAGGNPCRLSTNIGFRWNRLLMLLGAMLVWAAQSGLGGEPAHERGEFGGDLSLLASFCSGPETSNESNYFLDMWVGRQTAKIAHLNGLTNNRTLFINSHGRGGLGTLGKRYGFYPHQSLLPLNAAEPVFSAKDIARMLGAEKVTAIHNVVISSCDLESCFSVAEIKKSFPNATNIVHTPRGQAGYQPMFYSALVNPSSEIQPLYESKTRGKSGKCSYEVSSVPAAGAKKLNPYVAELFHPGAEKPYRTQVAGRELLETTLPVILLRASLKTIKAPVL